MTSIATSGIDNEIKLWQPVDESLSDSYNSVNSTAGLVEHVEVRRIVQSQVLHYFQENAESMRQQMRQDNELMAQMNSQFCVNQ